MSLAMLQKPPIFIIPIWFQLEVQTEFPHARWLHHLMETHPRDVDLYLRTQAEKTYRYFAPDTPEGQAEAAMMDRRKRLYEDWLTRVWKSW